ncbi:tetratricopeptide repeat protein [Bradyrhizobium sp. WSM2793]|uniref:tetratricopeptide repeat protein n=1 Tax=Bradyrhizobium sp. WSM2793 TaxID=1038866 RepID=UPI0012FC0A9B|nr:tetratricopeptide repeat protein [Bradyrhizobium sp. WSM2793]
MRRAERHCYRISAPAAIATSTSTGSVSGQNAKLNLSKSGPPCLAKLQIGADEEAVARFRRSVENNRNHPRSHFFLAAALAHLGRLDEARSAVQAGLALNPSFTIRRFRAGALGDNPTYLRRSHRSCNSRR